MSKKSRRKGSSGELEFAKLIGGKKTSRTGESSPDVTGPDGTRYEVKRRSKSFTTLYNAMEQAADDIVALRDDRKPWLITMTYDKYKELTDGRG
jgi:hypothetical protein